MAEVPESHQLYVVRVPNFEATNEHREMLRNVSSSVTFDVEARTTVVRDVRAYNADHAAWCVADPLGIDRNRPLAYIQRD